MSSQMQTLSVRVPADDIEWLAALDIAGAVTSSDKLRALIAQMKRQHQGTMDYAACVAWLRDLLGPLVVAIRELEHRHGMHSGALNAVIEWVPQIAATLLTARRFGKDGARQLAELEDALVARCFQLVTALLRLGVTPEADCYEPAAIERHLGKVLSLAGLISSRGAPGKGP